MNFLELVQPFRPIIDHLHQQPLDKIVLIANHLNLSIYNHGNGLCFSPGEFLQIRQSIYHQKSLQLIKHDVINCVFERAQLIPALQIALGFLKQDSRASIWTTYHLAYGDQKIPGIQYRANLIIDVHVIKVAKMPTIDKDKLNILLLQEILQEGKIGDKYMAESKYQKAFQSYQSSVKKIFSESFRVMCADFLNSLKVNNENDKNKPSNQQNRNKKQKFDKFLDKCNNICFKFLQLGVCVGQYLKVLKTGQLLLKDPKMQNNSKLFIILIKTYIQIWQLQMAVKYFLRLKKHAHVQACTIEQIQKQLNELGIEQNKQIQINSRKVIPSNQQQLI